jgi:glycosyltransferase involved in cell wall biosynthesis
MRTVDPPPDVTVVVPVYDERDNLRPLVDELEEALGPGPAWARIVPGRKPRIEILLVDDGSTDGSSDLIAALAAERDGVRGIHFEANRGQTAAFDAGFREARGRFVVTLDADLQNDPRDAFRLLEALADHDAAVGFRTERHDDWLRRASSRIANRIRNLVSGDDIVDTGCTLKAFRRECLADLKLWAGMHRFLPTLLRLEGYRVVQLPVGHRPRHAGRSKYGVWNRAFVALADLLAVRWMSRRRLDYRVVRRSPSDRLEAAPAPPAPDASAASGGTA